MSIKHKSITNTFLKRKIHASCSILGSTIRLVILISLAPFSGLISQNAESANHFSAPSATTAFTPNTIQINTPPLCSDDSAMSHDGSIVVVGCNDGLYIVNIATNSSQKLNVGAFHVSVSPNGRYIAFGSEDGAILQHPQIGYQGLFVYDTQGNGDVLQSTRIAEAYGLYPDNISITDDGNTLLFARKDDPNCILNGSQGNLLVLYHIDTSQQTQISCENYDDDMAMSDDASIVSYSSGALKYIYAFYPRTAQTKQLYTGTNLDGMLIPASGRHVSVSADGKEIIYNPTYPIGQICTLCKTFVVLDPSGALAAREVAADGDALNMSPDGRYIGMNTGGLGILAHSQLYDRQTGATENISLDTQGHDINASIVDISSQACHVLFYKPIGPLFLRNRCDAPPPPQPDRRPVIFIPGIGGSRLFDLTDDVERWPNISPFVTADQLTLYPLQNQRHMIIATDVLRTGLYPLNIYGPLLNRLVAAGYVEYNVEGNPSRRQANCSTAAQQSRHPTLFVFAYDWRQPNADSAQLLHSYIDCVRNFYPDTDIDIIAHSMGGLVARRMILDFPGKHHVKRLMTIGTPWLGAPKTTYILETGDFAPILKDSTVRAIIGSFTGAHELFPSPAYYTLADAANSFTKEIRFPAPFREDGLEVNNNHNDHESYTQSMLRDMANDRYGRFAPAPTYLPGSAGQNFHTYSIAGNAQDDWRGDTTGVQYIHIVGQQSINDTIGQVIATTYKSCSGSKGKHTLHCSELIPLFLNASVPGDGTVPDISATRIGGSLNLNAPNAQVYRCTSTTWGTDKLDVSHNALNSNEQVIQMLLDILAGRTSGNWCSQVAGPASRRAVPRYPNTTLNNSTTADATTQGRSIQLINATNVEVSDDRATVYQIGNDSVATVLPTDLAYTMTFQSNGNPLALSLTDTTQATRYVDIPLAAGQPLQLNVAADGTIELRTDVDGNGSYEQSIAPTYHITGADAADTDGPTIVGIFTHTAAGYEVTIVTNDAHGVARTLVSMDGTTYDPYTTPIVVPDMNTAINVLADDTLGNRSLRHLQALRSIVMLPITRR